MRLAGCESQFLTAAQRDGITLTRSRVPWVNQRGHLGLPQSAREERRILAFIFAVLGGQPRQQASRRHKPLLGDFLHVPTGTLIEVDTWPHFTTYRLSTLNMYPDPTPIGFDIDEYRALCRDWAPRADYHRVATTVIGFGDGGLQRQRAYEDALRDLTMPAVGRLPVIRVPAPDGDGEAAYKRVRDRLVALEDLSHGQQGVSRTGWAEESRAALREHADQTKSAPTGAGANLAPT